MVKRAICLFVLAIVFCVISTANAEVRTTSAGTYYLYEPAGSGKCPTVVYLHGQGGDETQGRNIFERYVAERNYVLIAPRGTTPSQSWMLDGGGAVAAIIDEVAAGGRVDEERILLVGYSAGGATAYNYGTSSSRYAAMACVNCYMPQGAVSLGRRIPVYLLECEGDPNLPAARQAKDYLEQADFDVTFEVLPGGSHAYPTSQASPKILDWFARKVPPATSTGDDDDDDTSTGDDDDDDTSTGDDDDDDTSTGDDDDDDTSTGDDDDDDTSTGDDDDDDTSTGDDDDDGTSTNDDGTSTNDNGSTGTNTNDDGQTGTNTNNDGTSTNDGGQSAPPPPEPVVNTYGLGVGGLTDGEIDGLVRRWLESVWKPSQQAPTNEGGWRLDDWGVWVSGSISHIGGIDGYRSISDFWLGTNPDCRSFVEKQGLLLHPPRSSNDTTANAFGETNAANVPGSGPTAVAPTRGGDAGTGASDGGGESSANASSGASGDGNSGGDGASTNASNSEHVPDLNAPSGLNPSTIDQVDGRPIDLFVPASYDETEANEFGLVVALAGIAGNTSYLSQKWQAACGSQRYIFAGLKAKNATGSNFGYRWENDVAENIEFITNVVERLEENYGLDSSKTVVVGFSNGGYFIGREGAALDEPFEGFVLCEGGSFIGSSDKQIVISGTDAIENSRSGSRWSAHCQGMGHKFPGQALPMYQDPGVDKTSDGLAIDAAAQLEWLNQ